VRPEAVHVEFVGQVGDAEVTQFLVREQRHQQLRAMHVAQPAEVGVQVAPPGGRPSAVVATRRHRDAQPTRDVVEVDPRHLVRVGLARARAGRQHHRVLD
jgi:hypothetical protein